jgi:amidophosphoribosyltransferase
VLDKFRDECSVFGIYGHADAARLTYLGLYALQHRGQESCGIVSANAGRELRLERAMGHVAEAFDQPRSIVWKGQRRIGHVRYSTAGDVSIREAQPFSSPASTDRSPSAITATFLLPARAKETRK